MNQQQFLQRYQFNVRNDRLGGGTFGTVYKAYDTTRDRYVAIKVAEVKTVNDKTFSLEDELKAVAGLPEHRNLAHYENVWQFESPAGIFDYAVMQYYPDGNLRQLLDIGQLNAQQRRDIASGLLRGLSHLHGHGVIHRDLKPSNILIAKVGQQYIPKIADFGLSKQVGEGSRFTNSLTGGTLAYSAPEQLLGKPIRLNADLWSAGVLLFELFLGYRPFRTAGAEGSSAARDRELFDQIVNAPLPPETAQIPQPFAEAVAAFLVKKPEERAARVKAQWLGGKTNDTAKDKEGTLVDQTLPDPELKPPVRRMAKASVPKPPPRPDAAPQPRRWLPLLLVALLTAATVVGVVWWLQSSPSGSTLQPVQDASGKWGYADESESYVLPAVYDSAGLFSGGYAQVSRGDSLLRIDEAGALAEFLSVVGPAGDTPVAAVAEDSPELEEPEEAAESDSKQEEYDAIIASAGRNYDRGNYERALGKYKSALGLVSDDSAAKAGISKCEEKLAELSESSAWSEARRRNTASSYESYLQDYPDGEHAREARSRLAELSELSAWSEAKAKNTVSSYESYLRDYPDGAHAREAHSRLEALRKPALPAPIEALERSMVRVSGGSFTMGCTSEQSNCDDDEKPAHRVELSSYRIGKYEVTQAQWEAVMGSNPSKFSGCSSCPVEQVSWNDVQEFIRKLNRMTGGSYRLPTEAEWEYAARGGSRSRGYKYSGSNNLGSVGWWYDDNSGNKTHPVGKKSPNELGLYDMSGNVWEWCSDWYDSDYYSSSSGRNPKGPGRGTYRVIRGGGWINDARSCRASRRISFSPDYRYINLGFRLAAAP
ncbi:MAG: SUMF1/EgtB/PvdO family nonheme iron enzyme [bacterium]|nr:SUMF1/EgtB/PvdO family nonheme iron enzyme [bacterium]